MARFDVRRLVPSDHDAVGRLRHELFELEGRAQRARNDLYGDDFSPTSFLASVDDRPAGCLLSFVVDRDAICTSLLVLPAFQRDRVMALLLERFVMAIDGEVDDCWFVLEQDRVAAHPLVQLLGALDAEIRMDFFGLGDRRLVARLGSARLDELRERSVNPRSNAAAAGSPRRAAGACAGGARSIRSAHRAPLPRPLA